MMLVNDNANYLVPLMMLWLIWTVFTQQHSVIYQKTWIFSSTTVRTSNLVCLHLFG